MPTDTSEQGLEALISRAMTGRTHLLEPPHQATPSAVPLQGLLEATQPQIAEAVSITVDSPTRRQLLAQLEKQIAQRGGVRFRQDR